MSQASLNQTVRKTRRTRILGPDARCSRCGCADPTMLVRRRRQGKDTILCYECAQARSGKRTVEQHHPLGEANDAATTIPIPGNAHRVLSDKQQDWPEEVRHNRHRDPLLELAGWCLSLKDHLVCWIERLGHVATWLVTFCYALREHFGTPTWWVPLGVQPLWGEAAA